MWDDTDLRSGEVVFQWSDQPGIEILERLGVWIIQGWPISQVGDGSLEVDRGGFGELDEVEAIPGDHEGERTGVTQDIV